MKFLLSSLFRHLETSATIEEICETLTKIGLEVESINDFSKILAQFSVAKIISTYPHPESKKLQICQVQTVDSSKPLQIVCGAANARAGIKVAYAKIGSLIPANQMVIKKAKIIGVESNGMLCSAFELGLAGEEESSGILEIPENFEIGEKLSAVYGKNDSTIEINVTPNRGDCLGVYGIARDLAATGIGRLKSASFEKITPDFPFDLKIHNQQSVLCSFGCFRLIKNIRNSKSPKWLVEELESIGINSVSAVVDVVNFVMHELCRPMHCYDNSKIIGDLVIRSSETDEKFTTLNDQNIELNNSTILIADEQNPLAIAGIIGGKSCACSIETTEILLEAACFDSNSISSSGRFYGINSDSRHRFERGVDWKTCEIGIEMATKLILEICGGSPSELMFIGNPFEPKVISFDFSQIKKRTGIEIALNDALSILESLEFEIEKISQLQPSKNLEDNFQFKVKVPPHRHDIFANEDLVEEVVRIWGYDKILAVDLKETYKRSSFSSSEIVGNSNEISDFHGSKSLKCVSENKLSKVRKYLSESDMREIVSWSFVDSELVEIFGELNQSLIIENPISIEMNHLRTNLALGLVFVYQKNSLRGFFDLSLFEIGNVFGDKSMQKTMIAGLRAGKNKPCDHYQDQRDFDIFDVKQNFLEILELYKINQKSLQLDLSSVPSYYHPHRSAAFKLGKNLLGYFGELHPKISKKFDLKHRLNLFEIFFEAIPNHDKSSKIKSYFVNDLQMVERDFAFLVDENLAVGDLLKALETSNSELIKEVELFDIFHGNSLPAQKKSIAVRIKIQPQQETMSSKQIDEISGKIVEDLDKKFGAKLREL